MAASLALLAVATTAYADYYKVHVKRIDQDLYRDTNSGIYIKTRYCYEYTYGDDAVLKYEPHAYDNKLLFESGTACDVERVFS